MVKHLLNITAVCYQWRAVATRRRQLWRYIDVCRPQLAQIFLERLGPTSRVTYVSSECHRLSPFEDFSVVSHCADRVDAIDLHLKPAEMHKFIYDSGLRLDNVVDLCLRTMYPVGSEMVSLHTTLPPLSRITLEGITTNWSAVSNLTHLHLGQISGPLAPSLEELRSILKLSSYLHTLILDRVCFSLPSRLLAVNLRHLRLLRVHLSPKLANQILSGIRMLLDSQMEVKAHTRDLEEIFGRPGQQLYRHISSPQHTVLSLDPRKIALRRSVSEPFSDRHAKVLVRLLDDMNVRALESISRVFQLANLQTLEIQFMYPDHKQFAESVQMFRDFLKPMTSLVTLRVSQALAGIIVPILGEVSTPENQVICPKLYWLCLGAPNQVWWGFPTAPSGSIDNGWLEPIVNGLRERTAHTGVRAVEVVQFLGRGHIEISYAQMRLKDFAMWVNNGLSE